MLSFPPLRPGKVTKGQTTAHVTGPRQNLIPKASTDASFIIRHTSRPVVHTAQRPSRTRRTVSLVIDPLFRSGTHCEYRYSTASHSVQCSIYITFSTSTERKFPMFQFELRKRASSASSASSPSSTKALYVSTPLVSMCSITTLYTLPQNTIIGHCVCVHTALKPTTRIPSSSPILPLPNTTFMVTCAHNWLNITAVDSILGYIQNCVFIP